MAESRLNTKILKGGALLSFAQGVGQLCSLGRNIIIARLITPADFGVATTFLMVVSLLEMMSNLSLDRLLVQAEDGDEPEFQKTAHFLQVIRGILISLILFTFAPLFAELFSIPEAVNAFYILAWFPLLNSFLHLDVKRYERTLNFGPGALTELLPQILMLACAYPIGICFGDYRAMLALLALKSIFWLIGTHVVAQRSFRFGFQKVYVKRFIDFGWPLLINGLLMFGTMHGDRFLITSGKSLFNAPYDMTDVGYFSAALMITMLPAMMISRISSVVFLPLLAHPEKTGFKVDELPRILSGLITFVVGFFGLFMILLGGSVIPYLYGGQYIPAGNMVLWLSVLWSIKTMRVLPASIAIAKKDTKVLMYSNIVRFLSLFGVLIVVMQKLPFVWILWAGILGEFLAFLVIIILNKRRNCILPKFFLVHFTWVVSFFFVSIFLKMVLLSIELRYSNIISLVALLFVVFSLLIVLRKEISAFYKMEEIKSCNK